MKKIISTIFDITFINFHFKKRYSIEEAKKTAYKNTSILISFLLFIVFINLSVILILLFKLEISKIYFYLIFLPISLLLYFQKKIIQRHILKPNIDFSIEKYSEEFIKHNKREILFLF